RATPPRCPLVPRRRALTAGRLSPTARARSAFSPLPAEQQQHGTLPASLGAVSGVAFSRDGKLLATADSDGTARLWNPVTRQPIGAPLRTGAQPVYGVAFSPDSKQLATAGTSATARLGQPGDGQPSAR